MITCDARPRALRLLAQVLAPVLAAAMYAPSAVADGEEQIAARALFNEARALIKAGRFELACPKLEAAAKLYRGSGVLLNLGDCFEHVGRTASAWNEFAEAASLAVRTARPDDEAEARRRMAAVEPRLARLVLRVGQRVPGLVLRSDGKELLGAAWDTPIPVDAGQHRLDASAPGYASWSRVIDAVDGATVAIDVPELAATPAPPSPTPPGLQAPGTAAEPPRPRYWTLRRELGAGVAATGVVALGAAGVLGLVANGEFSRANGETGSARVHDSSTAVSLGNAATVVAVAGLAATAIGAVIWLTTPNAPVQIAASPAGLGGAF